MNLDLNGKTALVGGGSRGIGKATAHELALLGCRVILLARNVEKLQEAVVSLPPIEGRAHGYVACDLSANDISTILKNVLADGPIHILINNSGGPAPGRAIDATADQFRLAFNQHVLGSHMLVTALVPGMVASRYGRIINVISTSVKQPLPNLGVSNTIRGAMANYAKTLANELAPFGITVNNVLPGATSTDRLYEIATAEGRKSGKSPEAHLEEMASKVPTGRIGRPEEPGAAIAFLASPAASYINGINLPVDGGRTLSL